MENREQTIEERLQSAAAKLLPDEGTRERILRGVKSERYSKKRLAVRIPAAVAAACLFICLLWLGGGQRLFGEELVVYAATEEYGWQRLKEGQRILLKREEYLCGPYQYLCTFRLEVPENYLYDREMAIVGHDFVGVRKGGKDVIEWRIVDDQPQFEGRVMQGMLYLWIVDENRERIGAYELELTREDDKCYAELNRVWTKRGK